MLPTTRPTSAYIDALVAAGVRRHQSLRHRHQLPQPAIGASIGAALRQLQRDEIVVCTKAGFLTADAVPAFLKPEDVVGKMHSMEPDFWPTRSIAAAPIWGWTPSTSSTCTIPKHSSAFWRRDEFDERLLRAFGRLETGWRTSKIRWYGAATWDGFRKGALSLPRMVEIALEAGGPEHHFRFIQLPFNLGMVEAYLVNPESAKPESVLQAASGWALR